MTTEDDMKNIKDDMGNTDAGFERRLQAQSAARWFDGADAWEALDGVGAAAVAAAPGIPRLHQSQTMRTANCSPSDIHG